MSSFRIEVTDCRGDLGEHRHIILIEAGAGAVRGAAPPAPVRLQYTCPLTGEPRIARFKPPRSAARPFVVKDVAGS